MKLRTLLALSAACAAISIPVFSSPVSGAPAATAADPVARYLHESRLHPHALPASLLPSAQQNPADYRGRVFEITGSVSGLVTADTDCTVLLTVGSVTLPAHVSASLAGAPWLDSGQTIRALLLVEPTGNDLSLTNMRLLAAAPEHDIALAERVAPAPISSVRRASFPSRYYAYRRAGGTRGDESVAGVGASSLPAGHPVAHLSARALAIYPDYRNVIHRMNHHLSAANLDKITTSVLYFSDEYQIDPRLVMAMIIAESDFHIDSTSRAGAMGLGQLMPSTARGLGLTNPYDPVQNIQGAVSILRGHLDQYGGAPGDGHGNPGVIPLSQIALVMAAYNAGPGAVHKYHGVPPYRETKRYVAKVAALYKQMCGGA